MTDNEANRFSARAARYARVGANAGGVAARMAAASLFGGASADNAAMLTKALGGLKGPMMKVAQLLATKQPQHGGRLFHDRPLDRR